MDRVDKINDHYCNCNWSQLFFHILWIYYCRIAWRSLMIAKVLGSSQAKLQIYQLQWLTPYRIIVYTPGHFTILIASSRKTRNCMYMLIKFSYLLSSCFNLKPTAWVDQSAAYFCYTPYQHTCSAAHRALVRMWLGHYEYHPGRRLLSYTLYKTPNMVFLCLKNDLANRSFTVWTSDWIASLTDSHAHQFSVAICVTSSECL